QMQLPSVEGHALAVEEPAEHGGRLLEEVEPLADRRERDAEGAALDLVPPRADAELAAAAADVVDRHRRFGEHADRPVADAEHETADAHAARLGGERGHRRDALERGLRRVGEVRHRVDVVPDRAPVKALVVRHPPQAAEVGQRAVLRTRMDAEAHVRRYTTRERAQGLRAVVLPTRSGRAALSQRYDLRPWPCARNDLPSTRSSPRWLIRGTAAPSWHLCPAARDPLPVARAARPSHFAHRGRSSRPSTRTRRQYPQGKYTTSSFMPSGSAKKTA